MASAVYSPTASQWASATVHLERRSEWRYFWRENVRYVSIISGRSNRLYVARADADGCSCPWSQNPWSGSTPCSHRIALELDALEADLIDARDCADAAIDLAFAEVATRLRGSGAGAPILKRYEDFDWEG